MATLEEKMALREQGKTYKEIAEILGISRQAVAQSLGKFQPARHLHITEKQCKYKGVRRWMNENKMTYREMTRRLGYKPNAEQVARVRNRLNGRTIIDKDCIDKILELTGMDYATAFSEE